MVDPVQNVEEPEPEQTGPQPGATVGRGVTTPGSPRTSKARTASLREHESNDGKHLESQSFQSWPYGKLGLIRLNRVFERNVEHGLLPEQVDVFSQPEARDVFAGRLVGGKRRVRRQGHTCRYYRRDGKTVTVFVDLDVVGKPQRCGVPQQGVDSRQFQVAGSSGRPIYVDHGLQRNSYQDIQSLPFGLDPCLNRHVAGYFVGRHCQRQQRNNQCHQKADWPSASDSINHLCRGG